MILSDKVGIQQKDPNTKINTKAEMEMKFEEQIKKKCENIIKYKRNEKHKLTME